MNQQITHEPYTFEHISRLAKEVGYTMMFSKDDYEGAGTFCPSDNSKPYHNVISFAGNELVFVPTGSVVYDYAELVNELFCEMGLTGLIPVLHGISFIMALNDEGNTTNQIIGVNIEFAISKSHFVFNVLLPKAKYVISTPEEHEVSLATLANMRCAQPINPISHPTFKAFDAEICKMIFKKPKEKQKVKKQKRKADAMLALNPSAGFNYGGYTITCLKPNVPIIPQMSDWQQDSGTQNLHDVLNKFYITSQPMPGASQLLHNSGLKNWQFTHGVCQRENPNLGPCDVCNNVRSCLEITTEQKKIDQAYGIKLPEMKFPEHPQTTMPINISPEQANSLLTQYGIKQNQYHQGKCQQFNPQTAWTTVVGCSVCPNVQQCLRNLPIGALTGKMDMDKKETPQMSGLPNSYNTTVSVTGNNSTIVGTSGNTSTTVSAITMILSTSGIKQQKKVAGVCPADQKNCDTCEHLGDCIKTLPAITASIPKVEPKD